MDDAGVLRDRTLGLLWPKWPRIPLPQGTWQHGITVHAVCPAARTRMTQGAYGDRIPVAGGTEPLYRPFTSEAAVERGGTRWSAAQLTTRVEELLTTTGMQPAPESGTARLRCSMTQRS